MHPIIESIENDNYEQFSSLLNSNPEYLNEVNKEGLNLVAFATDYEMPEFVELLLEKMTEEQINKNTHQHPLYIAIENKSPILDILIKNSKVDLQTLYKSGDNLLYFVDYFDRKDLIPFLMEAGVNPLQTNNVGQSPILYAIEKGNDELFDIYTQNVGVFDSYSEDWIKKAIKHNRVDIFKRLQPHSNLSSDELFNLAINFEHIQISDLILDAGDLIPGQEQITKIINLMCPKYEDQKDQEAALRLADFLFSIKLPFNRFVNEEGQSAWNLAVFHDNEIIFEKLIASNETVNIIDYEQQTPLFYAIKKNNLHFISSVLKKKANVNHVDVNKNTPLIQAVKYSSIDAVREILSYTGVLVNEVNSGGETALSIAVHKKRIDMVTALIWAGAEITKNPVKFIEDTSIYQIGLTGNYEKAFEGAEERQIDSFMALSHLGFKLNQINDKGDTFLLHFIKNGYLANFKALLLCGFDGNQVDVEGNSALMCAMRKNDDTYALSMLWKFKSLDYDFKNNQNETVYDIAAECNSPKRVLSLLNNDPNLKLENVSKVLPIIALSGSLVELDSITSELKIPFNKIKDQHNQNLLMLSVLGNNFDNFKWLLKQEEYIFDTNEVNKKNEDIIAIINKLPEEDAALFMQDLTPYLNMKKKLIK